MHISKGRLPTANYCYPGALRPHAILGSGLGLTIVSRLKAAFLDVQVMGGVQKSGKLKVADGRVLELTQKTCPVRIGLYTSWGLMSVDPLSFAVPGN